MFKAVMCRLILCCFVVLVVPYAASANPRYAALVVDVDSGRVVHQENANSLRYPASLTKLMTLYMTFQALERGKLSMEQKLPVSTRAAGQPPSSLYLKRGQRITTKEAILATVIKSANDVAVVLAEAIGGTEWQFAIMMNRTAKHLGMTRTHFKNASGLHHRQQRSTAKDLARLAMALRRDFPQYYGFFNRTKFSYNGRTYVTHNRVVRSYRGADGLKTGYIRASGYNLITSAKRNGESVVAVVLGGRSTKRRDRHMVKLLDSAFYQLAQGYKGSSVMRLARTAPDPKFKPGGVQLAALTPIAIDLPSPVVKYTESYVPVSVSEQEVVYEAKPLDENSDGVMRNIMDLIRRSVEKNAIEESAYASEVVSSIRGANGVPIPQLRPIKAFSGVDNSQHKEITPSDNDQGSMTQSAWLTGF